MAKLKKLTEQEMFESKNRFKKLCEYSFVNQEKDLLLDEDDDNSLPNQNKVGDDEITNNSEQELNGISQPDLNPKQNNQSQDGQLQGDQPNIDTSTQPNAEIPINNEPEEVNDDLSNDVEIDITDLTDKQTQIDDKVENLANQTNKMMDLLSSLANNVQGIINNTDSEISSLKQELIKRNPTPVETLQKRITVSDPFSQTPEDYWNKKQSEGHYKLSDNDNTDKEYELKASDINNSNPRDIYKSFDLDDDEINQSLESIFGR